MLMFDISFITTFHHKFKSSKINSNFIKIERNLARKQGHTYRLRKVTFATFFNFNKKNHFPTLN